MMKLLNILIAVTIAFNSMAQIPTLRKEVDWKSVENILTDSAKLKILSQINGSLFFYLEDNKLLNENLKNFHFLYLNEDKFLDFIYVGYSGAELPATLIYTQNEKGDYKNIFEVSGVIHEITNLGFVNNCFQFKIINNDGCYDCLGVKNLSTYLYLKKRFDLIELVSFTMNTLLPSIELRKQFKIVNAKYYLRSFPEIKNEGEEADALFGNVVAEFGEGIKGRAYAKYLDDSGRVWWFVALKSTDSTKSIFQQQTGYYVGWMSSRFLEEI